MNFFKSCIQCLPLVSSESPPSSPRPSPAEKTNTDNNAAHAGHEKPSFSDSSLIHGSEQKVDLPISEPAKVETGSPSHPSTHGPQPAVDVHGATPEAVYGSEGGKDASLTESVMEEKLLNGADAWHSSQDVNFSISGVTSLPSPLSLTPISLGYTVGSQDASHEASSDAGKDNDGNEHSHHQHFNVGFHHHHHHHHLHHHHHDDVPESAPHPGPPLTSSGSPHVGVPDTDEKHHLEVSHSAPQVDAVPSHVVGTTEPSSTLETSYSEPIEVVAGTAGHGHFFRNHLKDLHDKLKQEGHHLKEEGSKHLHNILNLAEEGSKHRHQ